MKVNIDVQSLCYEKKEVRGISIYTLELARALLNRRTHQYSCSFTDYNRERGNYRLVKDNIGDEFSLFESVYECSKMSFRTTMDAIYNDDVSLYKGKSYEEIYGVNVGLLFFPYSLDLPPNVHGKKCVVTVHDVMPVMEEFKDNWAKRFCKGFLSTLRFIKENDNVYVCADSLSTKNDLQEIVGISDDRIEAIPLGVNTDFIYHQVDDSVLKKYNIDDSFVFYLGAMDPRKGIDTLIKAVPALKDKDIKIVLAGVEQKNYSVKGLIRKCGNNNRIVYIGPISDYEKRILMSMAEVFVFPSRYEGFGLPVLEAMACGTPVITADNSSLPEVGGEAAIYFETGNSEDLADKIEKILSDNELRKKHQELGTERIKKYTWSKTAEKMEKVFEECK